METIAPYYKAITAILVPFLTAIGAALLETSDGGSKVMTNEWVTAAVIALVSGGAVFAVPNKDPRATHQAESVRPPELS
jgi:hypothetical protein